MTHRPLEIESLAAFDEHISQASSLNGWLVQSVDLADRGAALRAVDPRGGIFLGCRFSPALEEYLRRAGALLFPRLPDLPFNPYRARPYDAVELYGAGPYAESHDAAVYAWSKSGRARALAGTLASTLHDHAITDSLDDAMAHLDPRGVVGVMGGHALRRTDQAYVAAARLAETLTRRGRTVVTGGGPGAMEAANLGAYLSPWAGAVESALEVLATTSDYRNGIDAWISAAFAVRTRWPIEDAGASLSIPTWFYGHEPSNAFATTIAKYFANALREDTLLQRCRGGIVYLPGQAGTVQEIFQALTENFYAADATTVSPMILVGIDYWTQTLPAWPLLESLGRGRPMAAVIRCVDSVSEAADLIAPG